MQAYEVRYKLGEKHGMLIAVCNSPDEIQSVLTNNGLEGAEVHSVRPPRIQIKCTEDSVKW